MSELTAVVWANYRDPAEIINRGYWDQGLLERVFDRTLWRPRLARTFAHVDGFPQLLDDASGAVVVVPAQHHADPELIKSLQEDLSWLDWALVILTGDECSLFDWRALSHPNMKLWIMTPRPELHADSGARFLGEGWPYDTPEVINRIAIENPRTGWFFAGQVTHRRREECVAALKASSHPGVLLETPGFTQGLERHDYLRQMAAVKAVPCPSGPGTPDSFRCYEALEMGCIPLVDAVTSDGWTGYWPFLLGEDPPFPVIEDWATELDPVLDAIEAEWPANVNRVSSWWQLRKRELAYQLEDDLHDLTGRPGPFQSVANDDITILMPTSPIASHPSPAKIEQTIDLMRAQLPDAEILIMADGVRSEQADRWDDYQEYLRRLQLLTTRWHNVVVQVADRHLHQANLTRAALPLVRTPFVLFVEHDLPVIGSVPWEAMCRVLSGGEVNVIRLDLEQHPQAIYDELMLDPEPVEVEGLPLRRTRQWSQRPHLATTQFYRWMIDTYFGAESRTMIEDVMHGVVDHAWREHGEEGLDPFRLAIYQPAYYMKRCLHLDGRGAEPKYDMVYAYDGETPPGAPAPTSGRSA